MRFADPHLNFLFLSVAAVALILLWAVRVRARLRERFVDKELLGAMAASISTRKRFLKAAFLAAAVWLAVFALMRPQWGFKWEEVKRKGLDILFAMDVSKSMLARDVAPNRLDRSILAVKDMVGKLKGDRVGLIAFAGKAFLQCPLTLDYSGFMLALDDLEPMVIPREGTSISGAIWEAIRVLRGKEDECKVLVLITDGEDHEGDPVKASLAAKKEGIKIFCVGVGTPKGELIPVIDEAGQRGFLKDKAGAVVKSSLNEEVLKTIAFNTDGAYIHASGAEFGLATLYREKISKLEKHEVESKMQKQYFERFQIFLAVALALLCIEPLIGQRRRRA